jgi:hypothetical protein
MKRAITMAKDNNLNVYSSPTQTTRYISLKNKLYFLLYETFYYSAYKIYKYSLFIYIYLILFTLLRLSQNFRFGKAILNLGEKAGLKPLFPRACPKTVRFQRTVN